MRRRLVAFALALLLLASSSFAGRASVNVGVYSLFSGQITTALSSVAQTPITSLDGAKAVSIVANFAYGSGGSTASAVVQTTLDGTNWYDVARFDFTTSTRIARVNLSGLTAIAAASYSSLASEGQNDGLIGNQFRTVLTTTGTYVNTTLSVAISVR